MQTNEAVVAALRRDVEDEVQTLIRRLADLDARQAARLQDLEREVLQAVFRLGRRWLGSVLAWQAAREPAPARRTGGCGHQQRLVGWRPKQLLTLLGVVPWSRAYYQCPQCQGTAGTTGTGQREGHGEGHGHGEAPADARVGVVGRRTSAGVQEAVGYLAAFLPLEEVAVNLSRRLPLHLSARQVLALIQPVGEALQAQEDAQVAAVWTDAAQARTVPRDATRQTTSLASPDPIARLYIELDGVMARVRRGSVPFEGEEAARDGDVYREVKVGAVFVGTPGRACSSLAADGTAGPTVRVDTVTRPPRNAGPAAIRYVARRTSADHFGPLLYRLAHDAGLDQAQEVVVLGDGAAWIWRLADEHFPQATQIVDLWHAQQHVWTVAHAVFGRGALAGAVWAEQACGWLVQGDIERLVAAIQALPAVSPEPGQARSIPEVEADYFTGHAARMRYPAFRARGLQVGSGIAEAGCKTVVTTRAKRSGMRWSPAGLDALLPLRTAVLNGTYDAFWQAQPGVLT